MANRQYGGGGIFMMPTIGEQIGPELEGLAKNIRNIVKPNYEIQAQLKQAIAQNPELLQRLIDMGPEQVGKIFGREAAGLGIGELSMEKQISNEAKNLFQTDPNFKAEKIAAATGTLRPNQRRQEELGIEGAEVGIEGARVGIEGQRSQNRITGINADIAEQTEQAQVGMIQSNWELTRQKLSDMQQAVNAIPNIGNIDIAGTAQAIASGKQVDPMTLMRLQQAGIEIGPMVNSIQENANRAAQLSIANIRQQPKEVKAAALAAIEKLADDKRNEAALADSELRSMHDSYVSASRLVASAKDKTSSLYLSSKATVDAYEAVVRRRDNILSELDTVWNPKRIAIIGDLYAEEFGPKKGKDFQDVTSNFNSGPSLNGSSSNFSAVAPPEVLPIIEKTKNLKPAERTKLLAEFKARDPIAYEKFAPWLSAAYDSIDKKPAKNVVDMIKNKKADKFLFPELEATPPYVPKRTGDSVTFENQEDVVSTIKKAAASEGFKVEIISGTRSPERNKKVGGVPDSLHISGDALDIKTNDRKKLNAIMKSMGYEWGGNFKKPSPNHYQRKRTNKESSANGAILAGAAGLSGGAAAVAGLSPRAREVLLALLTRGKN